MSKKFLMCIGIFINIYSEPDLGKNQRNLSIVLDLGYSSDPSDSLVANTIYNLMRSESTIILCDESCYEDLCYKLDDEYGNSNFLIYKNDCFYLIVPLTYFKSCDENIGLNLTGFKKINFQKFSLYKNKMKKFIYGSFPMAFLQSRSEYFLRMFTKLFKDRSEYFWNISLFGHGCNFFMTGGLTEKMFKKLLNILKNINVKFFYYNSCYAGGKVSDYIYGNEKYPFVILSQSFTDSPSYGSYTFDYRKLFGHLNDINLQVKEPFLGLAEFIFDKNEQDDHNSTNLLLVRNVNSTYFEPINIPTKVKVVTNTTTQEELDKIQAKYVILNSPKITNIINFSDKDMKIYSALKGISYHYLDHIKSSNCVLDDITWAFYMSRLQSKKIFLIKEINCIDEERNPIKYENVIIFLNSETPLSKKNKVRFEGFCIVNDKPYIVYYDMFHSCSKRECFHWDSCEISEADKKKYMSLFENCLGLIEKGKQPLREVDTSEELRRRLVLTEDFIYEIKPFILGAALYKLLQKAEQFKVTKYISRLCALGVVYNFTDKHLTSKISSTFSDLYHKEVV